MNRLQKKIGPLEQLKKLNTPLKIQDYLDSIKINFEKDGDQCSSPVQVLRRGTAHCIEAALLAAAALKLNNKPPLLLDLVSDHRDVDHVVCLFKENGLWGAISKSNHHALRYRDPIYKTVRELAVSYFHEYLNTDGQKTLRTYSKPFNLNQYEDTWITAGFDLWGIADDLNDSPHIKILPPKFTPRPADSFEARISNIAQW